MVSVSHRSLWLALVPLALAACGNDSSGSTARSHVPIALSDAGCDPAQVTVSAGKIAFDVTNQGSSKVTEFYVKRDTKTIGEVENVVPGSPKTLTLTLEAGSYDMRCPNGTTTEMASLDVTDTDATPSSTNQNNGSTPPVGGNSGGGVQPGVTATPNVTTNP